MWKKNSESLEIDGKKYPIEFVKAVVMIFDNINTISKWMSLMARIIINDPIHDVMDFGNDPKLKLILKSIIDTNSFQKLRRISQLGLTSFVFPGATHSRFSHSLGTSYLSTLVLKKLGEQDPKIKSEIDENFNSVAVSALLHDIGHGPFSHSFEYVLKDLSKTYKLKDIPMHENWTAEIIKNSHSDINNAIKANGLNPDLVASPFVKNSATKYPPYLKQMISSQIDVDRMDYLLRDSHFSGVAVGKFDLNYLINCLQVIEHSTDHPKTLGLFYKGVKPYEGYLISRHLMNKSVYYHRKVKTAEYMAESIFKYLINKEIETPGSNPALPNYLKIIAQKLKDPSSFNLQLFLNESVGAYVNLTEDDFWFNVKILSEESGTTRDHDFAKRLLKRNILKSYIIQPGKESICKEILSNAGFNEDKEFKIKELDSTMYKQTSSSDPVFVKDTNGVITEISTFSMLINSLSNKVESEKILIVLDDSEEISKIIHDKDLCSV